MKEYWNLKCCYLIEKKAQLYGDFSEELEIHLELLVSWHAKEDYLLPVTCSEVKTTTFSSLRQAELRNLVPYGERLEMSLSLFSVARRTKFHCYNVSLEKLSFI